ncbi:uncharacterized protein K444DRAFT_572716, partial [Hyaloscypha bicolor E]
MNIVWSCVSILLVCTYKCLHFNIPSFEEKRAGCYLRKLGWMLGVALAPEVGVGLAVMEYFQACKDLEEVKGRWPDLEIDLVHAFYARMGGFAVQLTDAQEATATPPKPRLLPEIGHDKASELATPTETTASHDIKDRSKTDAFSKVFAIVQSSWLIVQSITRVASGLSLSQLELATMAYIIPAAVIYGFWLEKPFGVEHVTTI